MFGYKQEQSKKTNNAPPKNENEHAKIDVTRWFVQQKKQVQNEPQKSIRKLQQGKRTSRKQNNNNKQYIKSTKTNMHAQEVTEIEEVVPATTCRKARNTNVDNVP